MTKPSSAVPEGAFAIVHSRYNAEIVQALVKGARDTLKAQGVGERDIRVTEVPGAWELPLAAAYVADDEDVVAVIALGCVVRGETRHFEHVADECARGLMTVQLESGIPVANGVLAVEQYEHARERAGGKLGNKGEECALAAITMARLAAER
ncbi:6,7-dimethyl-8-ribityllumazine synthase [Pseudofulvimonas gallinarii]|jgi:6,7-dimethyl-8-ribityllumazine synthase|uniref:6,7-dimethyl-8-ribityllumazine synthase n=1 Tax=Pseudofulvimonas gallinarii TaxID=634155 RepID=A0A4S3KT94_9GAMM|nr:6,7-dimethyl-8-ribityllumazine synthase [Pseudofulvimonas gallinarii]TCT00398.1 6,7-dimethyl-8-ribityllumazine synthase [Pseudofulvimonas gallinarii]THD12372.1 6,7-dimethyl-8-ribityllumazine synthase [Pseudofulvimonas gallinarii]